MRNLIDDRGLVRREQNHVAIARADDMGNATRYREFRMFGQMDFFAVRGHGDFRPDPIVKLRDFTTPRMTGRVDER